MCLCALLIRNVSLDETIKQLDYDLITASESPPSQFDACISDLVRCVALARLAPGESHLQPAQAHVRLAEAYLQYKGTVAL